MKRISSPRLEKVKTDQTFIFIIGRLSTGELFTSDKEQRIASPTRVDVSVDIRWTFQRCPCLSSGESSAAALDRSVRFEHGSCTSSHVRSCSRSFGRQHSPGDQHDHRHIVHSRFVRIQTEHHSAALTELQATPRHRIDRLPSIAHKTSIHRA